MRTNRYTRLGKMLNEREFLAASPRPALEVPTRRLGPGKVRPGECELGCPGGGSGQGRAGESLELCCFFLSTPSRAGGAGVQWGVNWFKHFGNLTVSTKVRNAALQ